jgi:hypothetical protein
LPDVKIGNPLDDDAKHGFSGLARVPIPAGIFVKACTILNVEKAQTRFSEQLSELRDDKKSDGPKLELLERDMASSKTKEDTRVDNTSVVDPMVLGSEAGVHQEDDLDPDEDEEKSKVDKLNLKPNFKSQKILLLKG